MALPSVNSEKIDEALARFDNEERALPRWQGWETRDNFKYAIAKNGHLYPPKEIIVLATGVANTNFGGGAETNSYLRKRGIQPTSMPIST